MNIWTDINLPITEKRKIRHIAQDVCNDMDISVWDVKGESLKEHHVYARYRIATEARKLGYDIYEIGRFLNRSRTGVWHYFKDYTPPKRFT